MRAFSLRAMVMAGLLLACGPSPVACLLGQEADSSLAAPGTRGPVSPDSADRIRSSLVRPPSEPPFDVVDALGLPFRVAFFPLRLAGEATAELAELGVSLVRPREFGLFGRLAEAGFHPAVGSIGRRSGVGVGLRMTRFDPLYLETSYSIRRSQRHAVGFAWDEPRYAAEIAYVFQRDAEPHFWGLGPDSREEDRSDYRRDRQTAMLTGIFRPQGLTLLAAAGYQDTRVARGFDDDTPDLEEVFADDLPYGARERTRYLVAEASVAFDRTYVSSNQQRGFSLEVGSALFGGVDGTDSDFVRLNGSIDGHLPVNIRQALALRGLAELNRGRGEGVPFTHMATVGGVEAGRAYSSARLTGRDLLALISEWRYQIWRELHGRGRVESFLLLDAGAVEGHLSHMGASDLLWSYGFGMRAIWGGQLRGLSYVAFGEEGGRVDLHLSWAF